MNLTKRNGEVRRLEPTRRAKKKLRCNEVVRKNKERKSLHANRGLGRDTIGSALRATQVAINL